MTMRLRPAMKDWNECLIAGIDRKDMAEKIPLKKKQVQEENPIEPFNVFYQTAEDGVGDTIRPRQ